jgi:sulfoxide reductase heme-binding subunit YedZ
MMMLAVANARTLWYLTRGSGVVALLLLTASVLLGIVGALRWRGERWPRFAVTSAHRNLTLLSIVFVALHVVTTVADGYAPIGFKDAVVPFASPYRPLWLGLGAVAFDLLLALVATSLLRARIGPRLWRAVHWLAYVSWPVALLHSFGTGSDARFGWLAALGIGCLIAVSLAALARAGFGGGLLLPRVAGAGAALLVPLAIFAWYRSGPLREGWARRAGTPSSLLAAATPRTAAERVLASAPTPTAPTSFVSALSGRVSESQGSDGLVTVHLSMRLRSGPRGAARIDLRGVASDEGVAMTASGVSFVPATTRATYTGNVVSLAGGRVVADVVDAAGDRLRLGFELRIDTASRALSGVLEAATPGGEG